MSKNPLPFSFPCCPFLFPKRASPSLFSSGPEQPSPTGPGQASSPRRQPRRASPWASSASRQVGSPCQRVLSSSPSAFSSPRGRRRRAARRGAPAPVTRPLLLLTPPLAVRCPRVPRSSSPPFFFRRRRLAGSSAPPWPPRAFFKIPTPSCQIADRAFVDSLSCVLLPRSRSQVAPGSLETPWSRGHRREASVAVVVASRVVAVHRHGWGTLGAPLGERQSLPLPLSRVGVCPR